MLDLFSGIGGFHLGLEQAGFKFDWVGFSEIDKYASKQYKKRFPDATELGSVTDIQCEQLPEHIDILCGGFPCQSFSIAGLRGGFEDTRGTLFFEIVRILKYYKDSGNPIDCFILENVKGLLSHDDGKTFATIYGVLADLDYSVECQLLNTRWFLPQNRERIYIVGHFGEKCGSKTFPIGETETYYVKQKTEKMFIADFRYDEGIRPRYDNICPTLSIGGDPPFIINSNPRYVTCLECERLQGFPDGWTEGQSDTQRYKQLGNAVSVPVVKAIGERLNQYL